MPRRREERRDKPAIRIDRALHGDHSQVRGFTLCLQPADADYLKDRWVYTCKFHAAPRQNDPVIDLIRDVIRDVITELNGNSEHGVLMCNHNFRVGASMTASPIWPPDLSEGDVKLYRFLQEMQEFPATAPVSIIPRERPLTADKIHVREGGKWIPVREWLIKTGDTSILSKRTASTVDYFWHKRNRKTFRLMDLPVELRLMIFERVIAPSGEVYPRNKAYKSWSSSKVTKTELENGHVTLGTGYNTVETARRCGTMQWKSANLSHCPTSFCCTSTDKSRPRLCEQVGRA
jgi:hypothetical protein